MREYSNDSVTEEDLEQRYEQKSGCLELTGGESDVSGGDRSSP